MHLRPPSLCELEISLQGVKLIMSLEDEYDLSEEVRERDMEEWMKNRLTDKLMLLFSSSLTDVVTFSR